MFNKNINILKMLFFIFCLSILFTPRASGQIYANDTLFIGNPDGSPLHVPYQGIVDIPVWINPYGLGGGFMELTTLNYAVPERLEGNFYYPWNFMFSDPFYYADYSKQVLVFTTINPPDSLVHLADFTFRMDIDESYIGDTLQIMNVMNIFHDTLGIGMIIFRIQISQLVIDDLTIIDEVQNMPEKISLLQNYPNPFNSSTTIEYGLPETGHVTVEIYDLLGRKVETIVNEEKQAGRYQVIWEANRYASGLYFYRLKAGDYSDTKRMVYLK